MTVDLPELLCRVNFPLYQASMVSPRHLLLAGGGGAAKTGVFNGFEIFEISHNGNHCVTESVCRHSTGDFAVMNVSTTHFDASMQKTIIAAGHNEKCQTYELRLGLEPTLTRSESIGGQNAAGGDNNNPGDVRRRVVGGGGLANGVGGRRKSSVSDAENAQAPTTDSTNLVFKVQPLKSIQTDFNNPEPYQKVCRISFDGRLLATGGDDGILRLWTFPDLNAVHEVEAHTKEIDDLVFSPDNSKVVTISKDKRAIVWDVKKGKKHAEMGWDTPNGIQYTYKRVRFARIEGDARRFKLFAIVNPLGASKPPAYLQRWDTKSFTLEQAVKHVGVLSALATSDNGNFVATGSMFDGTIEIYIAYNLMKLKRIEKAHSNFVTGLEFLPTSEDTEAIRGFTDASVVSISVDHQVCIHHIPRLRKISMFRAATLIIIILFATFMLCSYLGL